MLQTVEQRALKHLAFTEDTSSSDKLTLCKDFLKSESAFLKASHEEGASGLDTVKRRSLILDEIVRRLFDSALKAWEKSSKHSVQVALVALGGYGRGELSPWSDLDVMFLFPVHLLLKQLKKRKLNKNILPNAKKSIRMRCFYEQKSLSTSSRSRMGSANSQILSNGLL